MSVATNMRRADLYYCGTGFEALKCYVIDAEKGNKAALDTLSDIYEYGKSRLKKELGDIYYRVGRYSKAAEYYVKAAEKGNRAAIDTLRYVYEHGTARIQKEIGNIYYDGLGVEQNCHEGRRLHQHDGG